VAHENVGSEEVGAPPVRNPPPRPLDQRIDERYAAKDVSKDTMPAKDVQITNKNLKTFR